MGSQLSKIKERNGVNYHCPECKKQKKRLIWLENLF